MKGNRWRGGLVVIAALFTALACGLPPRTTATVGLAPTASIEPTVTAAVAVPSPTAAAEEPAVWLRERIDQVDAARLMADVVAVSSIHSRHVNSPGIDLAADYIEAAFAAAGLPAVGDRFPLEFRGVPTEQRNVVASVQGSDPEAGAILLGAHYDSRTVDIGDWVGRAPGANDNATGVAVLLEVARHLDGLRPAATIYLVTFSAEETGLQGSRHLVEAGLPRPVTAMAVFDIVGNSSGASGTSALRVFSAGPEDSDSRRLAHRIAAVGAEWVPELPLLIQPSIDRPGRYSDHVPFSDAGISAVRFIEDGEHLEWQHNALDTADRVDPAFLRRVAQLALAITVELAWAGESSTE